MEAEVYAWIRNIVVFMMINTIIMNLIGNKSYKKYVSLASGMILVLIVVSPLVKVLKLQESLDYFLDSNTFAMDTSNFKNELSNVEEEQSDAIYSEYKDEIKNQVKKLLKVDNVYLKSFEVQIDTNTKSDTYGEIAKMNIKATTEESQETTSDNLIINDISIDHISIGKNTEKDREKLPSPLEINLKNKLSDFYNIDQGNINISIQGG
jgi:Stage III sporulation protein AF (Spore_III_AF).